MSDPTYERWDCPNCGDYACPCALTGADQTCERRAKERLQRENGALRAAMIEIDRLLESDFGGYYLSAPADDPLGAVRRILRVEP